MFREFSAIYNLYSCNICCNHNRSEGVPGLAVGAVEQVNVEMQQRACQESTAHLYGRPIALHQLQINPQQAGPMDSFIDDEFAFIDGLRSAAASRAGAGAADGGDPSALSFRSTRV